MFFCNFEIFKKNSNFAVRETGLLQSFGVNELEDIKTFLRLNEYPKMNQARFDLKRACKNVSIENEQFLHKRERVAVMIKQQQLEIIKGVYEGIGQSTHSKSLTSHKGRNSTYSKISECSFWYSIYKVVASYIKSCENCQKQGDLKLKTNSKLHNIPVPSNVMKQVAVDLCWQTEVDEYRYLIVCIGYFSKWSEAKPITDKAAPTIASFCMKWCADQVALQSRSRTRAENSSARCLMSFIFLQVFNSGLQVPIAHNPMA